MVGGVPLDWILRLRNKEMNIEEVLLDIEAVAVDKEKTALVTIKVDGGRLANHFTVLNSNGRVTDCDVFGLPVALKQAYEKELR